MDRHHPASRRPGRWTAVRCTNYIDHDRIGPRCSQSRWRVITAVSRAADRGPAQIAGTGRTGNKPVLVIPLVSECLCSSRRCSGKRYISRIARGAERLVPASQGAINKRIVYRHLAAVRCPGRWTAVRCTNYIDHDRIGPRPSQRGRRIVATVGCIADGRPASIVYSCRTCVDPVLVIPLIRKGTRSARRCRGKCDVCRVAPVADGFIRVGQGAVVHFAVYSHLTAHRGPLRWFGAQRIRNDQDCVCTGICQSHRRIITGARRSADSRPSCS